MKGVILTVLVAEKESLAPELIGVGLWIDLAPGRLVCLDGSRNYSTGHLLQPVAAGWQPQSGSCLSPALVLGDCCLCFPIECHFSVITFGISDSILFQLQAHYVNLKKHLLSNVGTYLSASVLRKHT